MLIQVTYTFRSEKAVDPAKKAVAIALGQTTDTWTPNERSGLKKLEAHRGQVIEAREIPATDRIHYAYRFVIGYPPANTENDIPTLLTMIFGKISLDGEIRLEEIQFPPAYLKGKGPRFGIEGIRKKVGVPSKPLTMAIFKPCVGLTPKELSRMYLELALGGMHLVKDDEILPDLSICPTEKRLERCLKAGAQAQRETGQRTLYAVNLTGPVSQLTAKARRLAKLGAECFLLNVLSYGYGVLEELRDVGVPIMAHPALAGAIGGAPHTGVSYRILLGSLMRLGGADIVLFPSSYGTVALPQSETQAISDALRNDAAFGVRNSAVGNLDKDNHLPHAARHVPHLKSSFPGPSAGIHPGLVPRILQDYGNDVIINAGGGVHGHPQGARAGARAFRQAVDRALEKQDFKAVTEREAPELAKALALWGHG